MRTSHECATSLASPTIEECPDCCNRGREQPPPCRCLEVSVESARASLQNVIGVNSTPLLSGLCILKPQQRWVRPNLTQIHCQSSPHPHVNGRVRRRW